MGTSTPSILADLVLVSVVVFLPAAAGLLAAAWGGVVSRPAQAICALSAPCLIAYIASGFYLLSPGAGRVAAIVVYTLTLAGGALLVGTLGVARTRTELRFWSAPVLMAPAAAAISLGIGFLYGGNYAPLRLAESRYVRHLANDNVIPYTFAQQLEAAVRPLPHYLIPNWLSSDRPPLETSVYLLVHSVLPFADPHALLYETLGVLLQSLWMPALWCLLREIGLQRRVIAGGLACIAVSGFILFNSFYVWPKLLPAAFLVLLAAIVLTDTWGRARRSSITGIVCGLAIGLAMLGHEGSALAVVPLAGLVLASRRRWPSLRCTVAAAATVVSLLLPWTLYQRYYDPTGTDLTRLQLTGVGPPSSESLPAAIAHAYATVTPSQYVHDKWNNLTLPFVKEVAAVQDLASLGANLFASGGAGAARRLTAVADLRTVSFLYFLPALGLMVLAPIAFGIAVWLRRERGPDLTFAGRTWVFLVLAIVVWSFVLFKAGSTVNYQGSYALELLAFAAALVSLWRMSHALTAVVVVLQFATEIVTYATVDPVFSYTFPRPGPTSAGAAILLAAGIAAVVALPLLSPPSDTVRIET